MGLFQQRLAERRRQQHGAATLDITDLGTPDIDDVELSTRTGRSPEYWRISREPRKAPVTKPVTPPARKVRDPYTITCKQCGKTATRKSHAALYCSILCQNRAHKANEPKRPKHHLNCIVCDQPIGSDRRAQAKHCSDACARKWNNKRQADRREREREEARQSPIYTGSAIDAERLFNAARKAAKESA